MAEKRELKNKRHALIRNSEREEKAKMGKQKNQKKNFEFIGGTGSQVRGGLPGCLFKKSGALAQREGHFHRGKSSTIKRTVKKGRKEVGGVDLSLTKNWDVHRGKVEKT